MRDDSQKHLLFALLACQNELITKPQLTAAFSVWLSDRSKGLDQILVEQGALHEGQRSVLDDLVNLHLAKHGDLAKSLAQLSSMDGVVDELQSMVVPELAVTLPPEFSEYATSLSAAKAARTLSKHAPVSGDDRFRIIRHHANGGLGVVHVAEDQQLRREVALKQIRSDCADSDAYRSKFIQEAEVTGQLEHPGIVPVYGLGTDVNGRPYYAMRFIKGEELKVRIQDFHANRKRKSQPFDCPELRSLLRRFTDVCNAIDYAHDRGVLHRDLKPGNVMLGKHGETLVVDWGLAKPMKQPVEADPWSTVGPNQELPIKPSDSDANSATAYGSFLGTPAYAPPEQIAGELDKLCPQSDVYSLGAILYEILTGRPPIEKAESREMLLKQHSDGILSPRYLDSHIPKPLSAICKKAVSFNASDRYATAAELKHEIERWLDDAPIIAMRDSPIVIFLRWMRHHHAISGTLAASVVLVLIGAFLFVHLSKLHLQEVQAKADEIEAALARSKFFLAQARWDSNRQGEAIRLLYEIPKKYQNIEWRLAVREMDQRAVETFCGGRGSYNSLLFCSSDGNFIASSGDPNIRNFEQWCLTILNSSSGEIARSFDSKRFIRAAGFSPDGGQFVICDGSGEVTIHEWPSIRILQRLDRAKRTNAWGLHASLAFHPDGTQIADSSGDSENEGEITITEIATGKAVHTFTHPNAFNGPKGSGSSGDSRREIHFLLDGKRLCTVSDIFAAIWDVDTGEQLSSFYLESFTCNSCVTPDGEHLVASNFGDQIAIWDIQSGEQLSKLKRNTSRVTSLAISPDGNYLGVGRVDGTVDIWNLHSKKELWVLAGSFGEISQLCFSPDGSSLIARNDEGIISLWKLPRLFKTNLAIDLFDFRLKSPASSTQKEQKNFANFRFSPDGSQLLTRIDYGKHFLVNTKTPYQHLALSENNDDYLQITAACFTRDASQVFTAGEFIREEPWTEDRELELKAILGGIGTGTSTDEDGRVEKHLSIPFARIDVWDTVTGKLTNRFDLGSYGEIACMDLSPDGLTIACATTQKANGEYMLQVIDAKSGEVRRSLPGEKHVINDVVFSKDGSRLLSQSDQVRHWNTSTWKVVDSTEIGGYSSKWANGQNQTFARLFTDGSRALWRDYHNHAVHIWNFQAKTFQSLRKQTSEAIEFFEIAPDDQRCITYSKQEGIKIWDLSSGIELARIPAREGSLNCFALCNNGASLATAYADGAVKLYDLSEPRGFKRLEGHSRNILNLDFRGSDDRLETIAGKERFTWNARTGELLEKKIQSFSADSIHAVNRLYSSNKDWHACVRGSSVLVIPCDSPPVPFPIANFSDLSSIDQRWHRDRTVEAEENGHWYAAMFHRAWLCVANPSDTENREKFERAFNQHFQRDSTVDSDANRILPLVIKKALGAKM